MVISAYENVSGVPDAVFATDNRYDIPVLNKKLQADFVDLPFVGWGTVRRGDKMRGTWHFYVDDYRFTAVWKKPNSVLKTGCLNVVEPNYTCGAQTPMAVGLYRIYQKRWLARLWQEHGIRVFVDLNADAKFLEYNLMGVPRGWRSFVTRGYVHDLQGVRDRVDMATEIAGDAPLFVVYGGGEQVRDLCLELEVVWFPEQQDVSQRRRIARHG